jgi:DNA primase
MGIREISIEDETNDGFDTKGEKEKALHDIIMSIKQASLRNYMEQGSGDRNAFSHILEAKKALQELQKTHISLD